MIPAIPDYVVWVVRNTLYIDKSELSYEYPFTDLSKVSLKPYQMQSLDIPDPFTGKPFFLNRSDAEMIHGDLERGKDWMVMPYDSRSVVAKKAKPTSFDWSKDRFSVGRYVLIDLSGFEFEQEYRGVKGATTWLIDEMKDYDGKVFKIEDMLKEDLALICGYEWLTQWLVPVASPEHDSEGFKVGDRVRINFPKEHLLGGGNGTGIGINHFMKKRQGEVATIERVVERVSKVDAFRLKFDERPGCDNSWLWCSTWLQKA